MDGFIDYILKNKLRNGLIAFSLLMLIPLLYVSYQKNEARYILNGDEVVGVYGVDKGVPVKVEAVRNQAREEREVLIIERDKGENVNHPNDIVDDEKMDQLVVGSSISQTVKALNEKGGNVRGEEALQEAFGEEAADGLGGLNDGSSAKDEKNILILPSDGGNGVSLKWMKPELPRTFLLPLLACPLIFIFMYRDSIDKEKQRRERERTEILMTIPTFSDRLLLLLSCGLIYEDAFKRIAEGYRSQGRINAFGKLVIKASEEADGTNGESISYLMDYAGALKIKELSRLVGIIADNRFRGGDLSDKLRQEGRLLWNERKKKAEELGRKAETKLSGPMALMLIVLIAVTATPALIQI